MATLHLSPELEAELLSACERAYPREACGVLLGRWVPRDGKGPKLVALRLHPARNVAVSRPGSRFELAPQDLVDADSLARDAGEEIVGVYHSHPDAPPVPSQDDARGAQPSWSHVIVAVEGPGDGGSAKATSWRSWTFESGAFAEQKTCVC